MPVFRRNEPFTDAPEFDPTNATYNRLDCDAWIQANSIQEIAKEDADQDFPPSEQVQLDATQLKILRWVNNRALDCSLAVQKWLGEKRTYLNSIRMNSEEFESNVAKTEQQYKTRLEACQSEDILQLEGKGNDAYQARVALAAFKEKAGLVRPANFNGRDTWYWWLVGVVVVEGITNATLLAEVSERGWLGAITLMLLICVVNAGLLGAVIGEGWRLKNSVSFSSKASGWMLVLMGAAGMTFWNLLIGHFRDSLLDKVTIRAATLEELLTDRTVEKFLENPLALDDMLSWVLATIGAASCIFAATKWLSRDDEYPGFGKVSRVERELTQTYQEEVTGRREGLKKIYDEGESQLEGLNVNLKGSLTAANNTGEQVKAIVAQFSGRHRQYQLDLNQILAVYRSENTKNRSTPQPKSFLYDVDVEPDAFTPPDWTEVEQPDFNSTMPMFREARNRMRIAYEDLLESYPNPEDPMANEDDSDEQGDQ